MTADAVSLVGGACWAGGRWIEPAIDAALSNTPLGATRIARADRLTLLGASAAEKALDRLGAIGDERVATIGGSVLASLRTNERYERRRSRTGRAPPRDFPYTAPNAWLGEISAALRARGPSLCLVGGSDVGLVGIATAIRMLASGVCERAVVVVAESVPDDRSLLPATCRTWVEGAAAVVLERATSNAIATVRAGWGGTTPPGDRWPSSVDALARLEACARGAARERIIAPAWAGSACWVDVEPLGNQS